MDLPRNNLEQFYKYVTASTALKIIQGKQLRWSSPNLFNDPFDHQTGFEWDFSGDDLYGQLAKLIEYAVWEAKDYAPRETTSMTVLVNHMRRTRDRLPREKFKHFALEMSAKHSGELFEQKTENLNRSVTQFLLDSMVLCLSEVHDNVVMWSHYAESHQGAVFKLRRLEYLDHRFLVAQPVQYTKEPARYASLEKYALHLVGLAQFDAAPGIWQLAYRKHVDWSYENEWRIHVPLMGHSRSPWYYDDPEPEELFEAIYLGCRANEEFSREVLAARNAHLPRMDVYRAVAVSSAMRLTFQKVF